MLNRLYYTCRTGMPGLFLSLSLLIVMALMGCQEIIESSQGDAEPAIDASEAALSSGAVFAEFDPDNRRLGLPNDIVLQELVALGSLVDGTVRNMPIRIPFSGPIQYPFAGDPPAFNPAELAAWGGSVFVTDGATTFPALPTYAGGAFKAVYLDSNNDLVLVPGDTQFSNGSTYAVVVTKDVLDLDGDPVVESPAMFMVKSLDPLWDGSRCYSSLVDDDKCASLETLRAGLDASGLFTALAGSGIDREDIALLFTFAVESTDSIDAGAGTPALIAGQEATLAGYVGGGLIAAYDITWFSDLAGSTDTDPANAQDFTAVFSAQAPVTDIAAIYRGFYPCMNFLDSDGNGDWEIDSAVGVGVDCPYSNDADGSIEFWASIPATTTGVVVFQHGITRDSTDFISVANTLAGYGLATIAIDLFDHGSRLFQISGVDVEFIRPDDPSKTVGYMLQSRMDILNLQQMIDNNSELQTKLGLAGAPATLDFVGQSLGGIIGSLVGDSPSAAFDTMILNVAGGDLTDIILEGEIGDTVIAGVSASTGEAVGSADLNSTLLGLEMGVRHALFAGLVDPLAVYDPATATLPDPVLLQQMSGDSVVPNNNSELLSRIMGLTSFSDGDTDQTGAAPYRARWRFQAGNYVGGTPGHGFLLDGETTATTAGQTQMVTFILTGTIDDPITP